VKINELLEQEFGKHPAWPCILCREYASSESSDSFPRKLYFFPVDNTAAPREDPDIDNLRSVLVTKISTEPYVTGRVPFAWLAVLEKLRAEVSTESKNNVHIQKVLEIAWTSESMDERNVLLMLRLFNELGLVMHHPEPALRHNVILDPASFLVEPASRIICQRNGHGLPDQSMLHHVQLHERARQMHPREYDLYYTQGRLSRRLLDILWSDRPLELRFDLELLMVRYGLIVPLLKELKACDSDTQTSQHGQSNDQEYLVPAMLPPSVQTQSPTTRMDPVTRAIFFFARKEPLRRWRERGYLTSAEIRSEGFLPSGLFPQVIECVGR
jgi:hypothetical protein